VSGSGSLKAVDLFVGHEGLGLVVTFFKQISIHTNCSVIRFQNRDSLDRSTRRP
jgi:hypothetical protein